MGTVNIADALEFLNRIGVTWITDAKLRQALRDELLKGFIESRKTGWKIDEGSLLEYGQKLLKEEKHDKSEPSSRQTIKALPDLKDVLSTEAERLGITDQKVTKAAERIFSKIRDVDELARKCAELVLISELRKFIRGSRDNTFPSRYDEMETFELLDKVREFHGSSEDVIAWHQIRDVLRTRGLPIDLIDL